MITLSQKLEELKKQNQTVKDASFKMEQERQKLAKMFNDYFGLDMSKPIEISDLISSVSERTRREIELESKR